MESTDLKLFMETAHAGSISKAADHLGYVQSNVTAHIKNLESELNTSLFTRHNKGVSLTKDGELLLTYAEKILALLDEAEQALLSGKTLKIGTTQTIAGYFLPQYLMLYQTKYPDVAVSVMTGTQKQLESDLLQGRSDCIFTNSSFAPADTKEIFRLEEDLVLITPQTVTNMEQAWNCPVITNNIPDCPYRRILFNSMKSMDIQASKVLEYDSPEGILKAVELGMGISLLPRHMTADTKGIHTFSLSECPTTAIRLLVSDQASLNPLVMSLKLLLHNFNSCQTPPKM